MATSSRLATILANDASSSDEVPRRFRRVSLMSSRSVLRAAAIQRDTVAFPTLNIVPIFSTVTPFTM